MVMKVPHAEQRRAKGHALREDRPPVDLAPDLWAPAWGTSVGAHWLEHHQRYVLPAGKRPPRPHVRDRRTKQGGCQPRPARALTVKVHADVSDEGARSDNGTSCGPASESVREPRARRG